jgi:general secretion pathway protein C
MHGRKAGRWRGVNHNRRMSARWWAFGVWALVAASALAWGLRLFAGGRGVPPNAAVATAAGAPRGDIARIFGNDPPPVVAEVELAPASSRFQLLGVVAPRASGTRQGVALIAVDGKPAKAFRVGAAVDGDLVLKAVRARGADLGPRGGDVNMALDIPPPAPAATGTLPPAGGAAAPTPPPPPVATGLPVVRPPAGMQPGVVPPGAVPPAFRGPMSTIPRPGMQPAVPVQPANDAPPQRPEQNQTQ